MTGDTSDVRTVLLKEFEERPRQLIDTDLTNTSKTNDAVGIL